MDKQLSSLQERIKKGRETLAAIKPYEPKYAAVKSKLDKMLVELEELQNGKVSGTLQASNQTYDRVSTPQSEGYSHGRPEHHQDPRPDLTEDAHLWKVLLQLAHEHDADLCAVLNGFRCGGTRLRFGESRWVLRPDIDSNGCTAWASQEEYDEAKQIYLQKWGSALRPLLDQVTEYYKKGPPSAQRKAEPKPEPKKEPVQTMMQI